MLLLPHLALAASLLAAGPPPAEPDRFAITASLSPTPAQSIDRRFAVEASARLRGAPPAAGDAGSRYSLQSAKGAQACGAAVDLLFQNSFE